MTAQEQELLAMYQMLPQEDQTLAFSLIRRLVLAWDPDYTKLTPTEHARLESSEDDWKAGCVVHSDEIDWS